MENIASRHMIVGGAAAEAEVSQKLAQYAKTISGIESECISMHTLRFEKEHASRW